MKPAPYILIADDDLEDQEMLADRFRDINPQASVKCMDNGFVTISWLEDQPVEDLPTLIIIDYKMPGLTAAEVLRCLSEEKYAGIPKIVWSNSNNKQFIDECMKKGADKYFVKPSSKSDFDELVNYLSGFIQAE
jgi:CheY-like chemotaxis protein